MPPAGPQEARRLAGLTDLEAVRRLEEDGPNQLPGTAGRPLWRMAAEIAGEPMFLLLVVGGAIYVALGDLYEALILLASVVVVMGITVYQERKTEHALEALRDLSSPRAQVIRDGERRRIPGRDVVRGDLLVLGDGDRIAADGVLVQCNRFATDESLLTGESLPASKRASAEEIDEMAEPGGDDSPFVYSGSLVVEGQGIARVLATGVRTQVGKIGAALQKLEIESSPLQRQTARMVRAFAALGLALCLLVVVLYATMRGGWLEGLLAGITLAMAMLPEEFPVVLTVFLALGAWRISQQRVLTRRVPAIETLGSATVLCVDKTGTLTENRMAVAELAPQAPALETSLLRTAALACELHPSDPMERAILDLAVARDGETKRVRERWRLVREYDLRADLLAVTHCWQTAEGGETVVAAKGAPEAIARLCRADPATQERILAQAAALAACGRRVLGVAHAQPPSPKLPEDPTGFAFSYLGSIALADPVRANVPAALAQCRTAGVRVVMVTGDHPGTAQAIAREIGLESPGGVVVGRELAAMNAAELRARVEQVSVYARVVPDQKLLLVTALKDAGEVVAMTGDGVNDAPALKAAHIGIAMGGRGTDVAREAASLVLLDDDFESIVETIRLGRRIFDNIRNAMCYLLAVHVPTAGMALLPLLCGWPLVFFPVHIVFLEFVIDPACSIAFEAEPAARDVMKRPPRDPREPLLGARLIALSLLQGLAVFAAVACAYRMALGGFAEVEARAVAFAALVFGNTGLILSNRSQRRSFVATLREPNRALWWVIAGAVGGLLLVLYLPPLREVFRFAPLDARLVGLAALTGSIGIAWSELIKATLRWHERRS
ncbi:MAG: cation-translocating P-type ATPase [Candidatus Binatia bacterium]